MGAAHGSPVGFACEKILQSFSGYNLFTDFVFTWGFKFSFPMTLELQPCELSCLLPRLDFDNIIVLWLESPSK